MPEDRKRDDLIAAQTVLLLAEMDEMIRRAKRIVLDDKGPVAVLGERLDPREDEK